MSDTREKISPKSPWPYIGHEAWEGEIHAGDRQIVSASTIAGRMPNVDREYFGIGSMLKQMSQDESFCKHLLNLADTGYERMAAEKLIKYKYGAKNSDGLTPAELGTNVHSVLEAWSLKQPLPTIDPTMMDITLQLVQFLDKTRFEPQMTEAAVFSETLGIGGRLDNAAHITVDGRRYENAIVDLKTKGKRPKNFYGNRHAVQMASYWSCPRQFDYEPRVWAYTGRRYLVSDAELAATSPLPMQFNQYGFIVQVWPTGYDIHRIDLAAASTVLPSAIQCYWWQVEEHKNTWKKLQKSGT